MPAASLQVVDAGAERAFVVEPRHRQIELHVLLEDVAVTWDKGSKPATERAGRFNVIVAGSSPLTLAVPGRRAFGIARLDLARPPVHDHEHH